MSEKNTNQTDTNAAVKRFIDDLTGLISTVPRARIQVEEVVTVIKPEKPE